MGFSIFKKPRDTESTNDIGAQATKERKNEEKGRERSKHKAQDRFNNLCKKALMRVAGREYHPLIRHRTC